MREELLRLFEQAPDCWYCGIKVIWFDIPIFEVCPSGPWDLCLACGISMPSCPCGQGCDRGLSKEKIAHAH